VLPLDRLAREAVQGSRTAMRGKRPELVDTAVRSALRQTIFRFELVMKINVAAKELLDREELIAALLASQVAMLLHEPADREVSGDSHLCRLGLCRRLALGRVDERLRREMLAAALRPATSTATRPSSRRWPPPSRHS